MKTIQLSVTAFVFLILFSCSFNTAPVLGSGKSQTQSSSGFDENELLRLVNEVRSKGYTCGGQYYPPVPPLTWNKQLESAATSHANYMNDNKTLSHTGNGGSNPGDRITATGYKWSYYAENIAMGQQTERDVMNSWLSSSGHCKNIMSKSATEMGAAKSGRYWAQVFARPR